MSWFHRPLLPLVVVAVVFAAGCDRKKAASAAAPATSATVATSASEVDALLAAAWAQEGVTPAPDVDDATFMRRAYLDLTGVVPTAAEARAFLANASAERRARLVDELLASDAFAKHWTNYWDDVLMEGGKRQLVDRVAFRQWMHGQLKDDVRYDELVRRLLTASGVNSRGGRPSPAGWELDEPPAEGVNGAVNFLLTGAQEPQNLAGTTSRVFLGVQIQCAECHDHPTEKWTQNDFERFTSAFMRVKGRPLGGQRMGMRRVEVDDAPRPLRRRVQKTGYGDEPPTALDGTPLDGDNPRQALAAWMTAKDNPWFARAIVNRMWGYFLGRGFVEPIDDMSPSNAPVAPELFAALTRDFVASGYDLRHLMRVITTSSAYQRAPRGGGTLWQSFALRPMNDTQLLDSLVTATGIASVLEDVAGERLSRVKLNLRRQFRFTFDVDEEASADTFTGTTPQALMLLNGALTAAGSSALDGSTLGDAARAKGGTDATVKALYLAALSREPTPHELTHWRAYVASASQSPAERPRGRGPVAKVYRQKRLRDLGPDDVAYEDILWALLNASEFFFIH